MERKVTPSGRVVWIEMVNGKKLYYYEKCKCGNDKNLKSSLCTECHRTSFEKRKAGGWKQKYIKKYDKRIDEFVQRIQSRNCMASTYEIFVEMIDLYCDNFSQYELDSYDVKTQVKMMWKKLNDEYEKRKIQNYRGELQK